MNKTTQLLQARIDELRERINYPRQTLRDRIAHARAELDPTPTPEPTTEQEPTSTKPKPNLDALKAKLRPKP